MKVKIDNVSIDVLSVSMENDSMLIRTPETGDLLQMISLLSTKGEMVYLTDDDNVVQTFGKEYVLNSIEQSGGVVYYKIQFPSTLDRELNAVRDAITNVELALCEIYESMGV